jgi:threonyl-tRNA synthetase
MDREHLDNLRHSCAHLLAAAVLQLYPDSKRTIGPPIDTGFYYDFDFGDVVISQKDLKKIQQKMRELVKSWDGFERAELSADEAKKMFEGNPYKIELIDEFGGDNQTLTAYTSGSFTDLCRGGHCENPSDALKHFTLLSVAGAYWRGDEKNTMLTRIYGTCFPTKEELDAYLHMREEAKKRDHRKLGKELDLFTFSPLVGSGLPLFTPRGTIVRDELIRFSEELQRAQGFEKVWIPYITKKDLYETSGHWAKFGDELFLVKSQETNDQMVLKPMNCPHHTQIYASRPRSYRDLPIRYMETTGMYRDEKAGELLGLSRVRCISIDDGHIFCTLDHVEKEFESIMNMIRDMYDVLDMKWHARLSFRDDGDGYLGEKEQWDMAENLIEQVAKKLQLEYVIERGEAAFYGPKIDIMIKDSLGRQWQCATQQLDFVQPKRFGLTYTDGNGDEQTPVMIHKALLGSFERFLSVYIEHTAGVFPVWLSPVQVRVIPVSSEKHLDGAQSLAAAFVAADIRADVDRADETVGKKIRKAAKEKIPYVLVVGDRELAGGDVVVRIRGQEEQVTIPRGDFITRVTDEIQKRA